MVYVLNGIERHFRANIFVRNGGTKDFIYNTGYEDKVL